MSNLGKRSKRSRGVILSPQGWEKLQQAQKHFETSNNEGQPYSLEDLGELTELSAHTLIKVRRRQTPVDRHSLERYFTAFNLNLTSQDYFKPGQTSDNQQDYINSGQTLTEVIEVNSEAV